MAIWEMTSLLIAPKKVFKSIYYHVCGFSFSSFLFYQYYLFIFSLLRDAVLTPLPINRNVGSSLVTNIKYQPNNIQLPHPIQFELKALMSTEMHRN